MKKDKLSTEPYKGVRDFYPRDMFVQNYLFDTMREVAERYGYQEYSASILEPTELYEAKSSEEIVSEQTYTFLDRGDRSVTLRPEMTPSVARMVAAKRRELGFPLRLYSIPNVFRYERPQRGRLREHWQLNCDIFGISEFEADTEIILLASEIMKAFGAKENDFEIRIGSRNTLEVLDMKLIKRGISEMDRKQIRSLLDKKGKMPEDERQKEIERLAGGKIEPQESDDSKEIRRILSDLGIANVTFDFNVVRGFEYYTGMIFEVFDTSPDNNRSLFGGGRYDNLLDIFGAEPVPAVGFGMGDVTMRDFLETHKLLPPYVPSTDLYMAVLGNEHVGAAHAFSEKLRAQGLNVAIDYSARKVADQIKAADKLGIRFVTFVGSDEVASKKYTVKNLKTGEEKELEESAVGDFIWTQEM
ncbi:MAG TPA: histidine--tRNA ligase [Candidatus Paceibacterota bacterium]